MKFNIYLILTLVPPAPLWAAEQNHLPYLLSILVSAMAVIKDFSTNYMKALGLNQAYMLLKLRNNYYIVLICSFGSNTGNTRCPTKMSFSVFLALTDVFKGFWTATFWLTFNLNGGRRTHILLWNHFLTFLLICSIHLFFCNLFISRKPINGIDWPARSPDPDPCDFFLWSTVLSLEPWTTWRTTLDSYNQTWSINPWH